MHFYKCKQSLPKKSCGKLQHKSYIYKWLENEIELKAQAVFKVYDVCSYLATKASKSFSLALAFWKQMINDLKWSNIN